MHFEKVRHKGEAIEEAVLEEIPKQVVGYMEANGIKTNKVNVSIANYFEKLLTMGTKQRGLKKNAKFFTDDQSETKSEDQKPGE